MDVIVFDTAYTRVPGDLGTSTKFDFPIRYKIAKGVSGTKIVTKIPERKESGHYNSNSWFLMKDHLKGVGIDELILIAIAGVEEAEEWIRYGLLRQIQRRHYGEVTENRIFSNNYFLAFGFLSCVI